MILESEGALGKNAMCLLRLHCQTGCWYLEFHSGESAVAKSLRAASHSRQLLYSRDTLSWIRGDPEPKGVDVQDARSGRSEGVALAIGSS